MQHKGKRQQNIEETDRLLNRLGQFSKKIDNFDNVDEYHDLKIALSFARETVGFNSNEEQLIKGLSLYYWNEDIDL